MSQPHRVGARGRLGGRGAPPSPGPGRPGLAVRHAPPPPRAPLAAALLLALTGCFPEAASLQGHACDPGGGCLSGWACVEGICVPEDARPDGGHADAGPEDAGTPDAGPSDGGAPDAGPDGGCVYRGEEICNGLDDDCRGGVDDGFPDVDGDGHAACTGVVVDCDDGDPEIHPDAEERCNGLDDDCDGIVPLDEQDRDGDGYVTCAQWVGDPSIVGGGDCNDGDPDVHPGALEIPCDGVDSNCEPADSLDEIDGDGDGFMGCTDPAPGARYLGGDCDDGRAAAYPGAVEICDGHDDDCDGVPDEPRSHEDPTLSLEPSGPITLYETQQLTVATATCDPAGCPQGSVQGFDWFVNTLGGSVGQGSTITLVPEGSTEPGVALAPGRHLVLVRGTDGCGAFGVARLDVTVGNPERWSPGSVPDNVTAVCAGPGPDQLWAGAGAAFSLGPDLVVQDEEAGLGPVRACAVGDGEAVFGLDGNNDSPLGYGDPADLTQARTSYGVPSGRGDVRARAMAADTRGRVWLASDGALLVRLPGSATFEVPPTDAPPDGGSVRCVTHDGAGRLWVCTPLGVNRLDVSAEDLAASTWLWSESRPVVEEALREVQGDAAPAARASALAANAGVLWAVTRDTDNVVVRLDLAGIDDCDGCALADRLELILSSKWSPTPGNKWTDLALWTDGDVLLGADTGLYRLQYAPPGASDWRPYIWQTLQPFQVRDLDVVPGAPGTAAAATDEGVYRYRGE